METASADEDLFRRYVESGDMEAFALLYDRHAPGLFRFLFRLASDSAAGEDLVQHTFLKVHQSRDAYDPGKSFRSWIFTIARRTALHWLEREGHRRHPAIPEDFADPGPGPERIAIGREEAAAVERALGALSREDAEAVLLCRQEGLSFDEIGEILGCSRDAAKMRVHRALRRLTENLGTVSRAVRTARG